MKMTDNPKKAHFHKDKLKVGVLMGGWSDEREISLKTGKAVAHALKVRGWQVIEIDVDRNVWETIRAAGIDVAFLALHGCFGEDGTIQGMLEMMGIPYTGSGVLASSLAIDKIFTKIILRSFQVPTPPFVDLEENDQVMDHSPFGYPVVVKPSSQGSTIGIHIVMSKSELGPAISDAFRYAQRILIEEFIPGREVTVGILGTEALPIVEIKPRSGFYDFHAKYSHGETEYLCPAPIDDGLSNTIQEFGLKAHYALGCRDLSRVDFRLREDGKPFCLEINTIPGMTDTSLLPKAAKVRGLDFPELVERILIMGLSRGQSKVTQGKVMVS